MWFAEYTQRLAYSILLVPFIGDPLDGGGIPLLNNDAEYSLIIPHDFKGLAIMATFAWWIRLLSVGMR